MRRATRILCVFGWLGGGEEREVQLLAQALDRRRHAIDVVACFRREDMPDDAHPALEAAGVPVDRLPCHLSLDETIAYLAGVIPSYDIVLSYQNVADVDPALERLHLRPPLVERGTAPSDVAGSHDFTARYLGATPAIRDAAAARMAGREHDALALPPLVETAAPIPALRTRTRAALGAGDDVPLIGWYVPEAQVEPFIAAAARIHAARPAARFVAVGTLAAAVPDLCARATARGLDAVLSIVGEGADTPALLAGLDAFVAPSPEDVPRLLAEAGAAALAVVAAGSAASIEDAATALIVPDADPQAVAAAIVRLIDEPAFATRLGTALRAKVCAENAAAVLVPQWQALFDTLGQRPAPPAPRLFQSFFQGGFECSTHFRSHDRTRIDVIAAVRHDALAEEDYRLLRGYGVATVRDGLRWHLIEREPGRYDWSSLDAQLSAARAVGTEVIWDLLHYGWPEDIDVWSPAYVTRFAAFAAAAARHVQAWTTGTRFYTPVNEISFLSWGGGDVGYLNPFAHGRGFELKVQLARASIAAMDAIRAVDPAARFVHAEPVINIVTDPLRPEDAVVAEGHRQAQFQAWDLVGGRLWPQIGGRADLLDVVGVNFYHNNQWVHGGTTIARDAALYKPFHRLLAETYARYGRPIFVAETGIEGDPRAGWFEQIVEEVRLARSLGVPVEGICLYPILDHPGWDDDRHCPNGLIERDRRVHAPLAAALEAAVAADYFPRGVLPA